MKGARSEIFDLAHFSLVPGTAVFRTRVLAQADQTDVPEKHKQTMHSNFETLKYSMSLEVFDLEWDRAVDRQTVLCLKCQISYGQDMPTS